MSTNSLIFVSASPERERERERRGEGGRERDLGSEGVRERGSEGAITVELSLENMAQVSRPDL
jgi:hypothetical protein